MTCKLRITHDGGWLRPWRGTASTGDEGMISEVVHRARSRPALVRKMVRYTANRHASALLKGSTVTIEIVRWS